YRGIRIMLSNTPDRQVSFWAKLLARTGISQLKFFNKSLAQKELIVINSNLTLVAERHTATICLYRKFYAHPIIKNYGQSTWYSKPSYLSNKNFAAILIDVIKDLDEANKDVAATFDNVHTALMNHKDELESEVFKILQYHLNASGNNLTSFSSRLSQWFRETMDRVSGWYTRNTHLTLFVIGFCLAVAFNIDSIAISTYLSRNGAVATQVAQLGVALSRNPGFSNGDSADARKLIAQSRQDLTQVNTLIGLGWEDFGKNDSVFVRSMYMEKPGWIYLKKVNRQLGKRTSIPDSLFRAHRLYFASKYILYRRNWKMFLGFLVTAVAIGLGAPFWFDLLNKFVNIRDAGILPKSVRKSKK
ncbi:MAG TPA: hypothetical protein VMV20_01755, partial [Chitinophagaceae bacterium]|nr:hypothetical protein [Chitinophagaceae bacterium]